MVGLHVLAAELTTPSASCLSAVPQENLKLSPAMLSRFDLIFVLLDRPDELMDQALSEHIMALHSGKLTEGCMHE
jgi:DNA replicative helicase MCM subunit Mcm2 (Cdc46/Mcm family)